MIEVATNYGPNPAPPRYVYLGKQQHNAEPEAAAPNAKTTMPIDWSDFTLMLMRTLMPFPDARDAVLAAVEAYEGGSP